MEHRWRAENRQRSQRHPIFTAVHYTQTRYVCSCGVATKWQRDERRARRERDRHALDGQLAHDK